MQSSDIVHDLLHIEYVDTTQCCKDWHHKKVKKSTKIIALEGFDPSTSGLWAQHASTAPQCCNRFTYLVNGEISMVKSEKKVEFKALKRYIKKVGLQYRIRTFNRHIRRVVCDQVHSVNPFHGTYFYLHLQDHHHQHLFFSFSFISSYLLSPFSSSFSPHQHLTFFSFSLFSRTSRCICQQQH